MAPRAADPRRRRRISPRVWSPPGHWRLLAFCLFVVLVVLTFQGIAAHTIGATGEPHDQTSATAPLAHARPILAARGNRLTPIERAPGRRIALTFDDGPDPRWTPKIVAVLRASHAPGTFFVVGSQAARYPDIVRALVRGGNELGNHTFTHAALTSGPMWQRRLQIQLTELWQSESDTETVVMVTHGIEEAIFLADRIVVMSNPPGPSVIDDIPVPLARPRDRATMIDEPAYHEVYDRLVSVLMGEQSLVA